MNSKVFEIVLAVFLLLFFRSRSEVVLVENAPKFVEKNDANEELKTLVYGSHGWVFQHPVESSYVYAQTGYYWIRYNISENSVDKVVDISGMGLGHAATFSANGKHAIVYNNSNLYNFSPHNIYFVDFEKNEVLFLAEEPNDLNVNQLPSECREGFDTSFLGWNITQNLPELDYDIISEYSETEGLLWYSVDSAGKKQELPELRSNLNVAVGIDSLPFVAVSSDTIISIAPIDNNPEARINIGFSKFVMRNLSTNRILQECPIID